MQDARKSQITVRDRYSSAWVGYTAARRLISDHRTDRLRLFMFIERKKKNFRKFGFCDPIRRHSSFSVWRFGRIALSDRRKDVRYSVISYRSRLFERRRSSRARTRRVRYVFPPKTDYCGQRTAGRQCSRPPAERRQESRSAHGPARESRSSTERRRQRENVRENRLLRQRLHRRRRE